MRRCWLAVWMRRLEVLRPVCRTSGATGPAELRAEGQLGKKLGGEMLRVGVLMAEKLVGEDLEAQWQAEELKAEELMMEWLGPEILRAGEPRIEELRAGEVWAEELRVEVQGLRVEGRRLGVLG
mmetsp:Transcript_26336/g.41198  ORF Transcript_26336/g.41198 Transcript_26336/m.41198 type:complete len:124 (+) Transcript_26336:1056-1427(+)